MDEGVHKVVRFDRFTLDLTRGCVRAGEQEIELPPKAFQVLTYLALNAGRLVAKEELLDAVWAGVVVTDESLVQCIRLLRQKLNDDAHRLIKTVPRRGYLLEAALDGQQQLSQPTPAEQTGDILRSLRGWIATAWRGVQNATATPLEKRAWAAVAAMSVAFVAAALLTIWVASAAHHPPTPVSGNHPFDGLWRVADRGNAYCFFQRGIYLWTIVEGRVRHDGDGDGAVSIDGQLSFKRAGKFNPSKMVAYSARLDGHRGSGTYYLEESKCIGEIEMTRLAKALDRAQ